jgi:hypothetical protein
MHSHISGLPHLSPLLFSNIQYLNWNARLHSDSLATKRDHMDEQTKLIEGFNINQKEKIDLLLQFYAH